MSDVQQQAAPQAPVISTETPVAAVSAPVATQTPAPQDTVTEAATAVIPIPADAATLAADQTADQSTPAAVVIPPDSHAAAQGIFESLLTKLENLEHALAADALAELKSIAKLLHL